MASLGKKLYIYVCIYVFYYCFAFLWSSVLKAHWVSCIVKKSQLMFYIKVRTYEHTWYLIIWFENIPYQGCNVSKGLSTWQKQWMWIDSIHMEFAFSQFNCEYYHNPLAHEVLKYFACERWRRAEQHQFTKAFVNLAEWISVEGRWEKSTY